MEGVIILSNNKPLLSTRFAHQRLADLAVDAFLNAKRSEGSSRSNTSSRSKVAHGKAREQGLDPVVWFDVYEDFGRHSGAIASASPALKSNGTGHAKARRGSYTFSSDEDVSESDSEEESDSAAEEAPSAAWASTSRNTTTSSAEGTPAALGPVTSYACCHIQHNNLDFLVPARHDCDPAIPFSYLYSLVGVLRQYLGGEVNDVSLRESFDVALQLLGETFSAPWPVSTDASALQELVPTSSLFNKMLTAGLAAATSATSSVTSGQGGSMNAGYATPNTSLFSSPLYWRRSGIRHAQNEIYFDINEEVRAILDKNGQVITGDVWGRIDCRSKLSGMPDISLSLSSPNIIDDPSFHPCVRIGRWTSGKTLSFIPPDGEFELMGYRLNQTSPASLRHRNLQGRASDSLPLRVRPVVTQGVAGGSFSISISPSGNIGPGGVASLEDIVLQFNLGSSATGVKASVQSNESRNRFLSSSPDNVTQANKAPSSGTWEFDTVSHTLTWRIPKLASAPTLSGTWNFEEAKNGSAVSPVMEVSFRASLTNLSGLSITTLKLDGERYSPYKGLRSNLKGSIEIRWT